MSKQGLDPTENGSGMSCATEATRAALIQAATAIFSKYGYDASSVRRIIERAGVNQAAINYHFGGKEGLYREVLKTAANALEQTSFLDPEELDRLPPAEALRLYLRKFLSPRAKQDRISQYLRICARESVCPSEVFISLGEARAGEAHAPLIFRLAERVARRFLPDDAPREEIVLCSLWLAQQPKFFDYAESLARSPFGLSLNRNSEGWLVERLVALSLAGLKGR